MDGTALTTLLGLVSSEGLDLLCLIGIIFLYRGQRAHEKHCRERHKAHYDAADDLRERVARLEGRDD